MSQQSVLTAIFEKINPAVSVGTVFKTAFGGTDSVRGRIFQSQASQDTVLPLCIFDVTTEEKTAYLDQQAVSMHEMTLVVVIYVRLVDGVAVGMTSENMLFDLLHMATITTTDTDIATIRSICTSRGVPTILSDAVSITTSYRVLVSKQS